MKKIKRANGDGSIWTEIRNGRVYYRGAVTIEVDNNGKAIRKTVGGYDRQTVVKKLREFQVLADKNILIEPSDEVFADYFKHWIFSSKKEKIMPTSFQKYETEYRLRIKNSTLAKIKMKDLKATHLQYHFDDLQKKYPLPTIQKNYRIIKHCLDFAMNHEDIYKNPIASVMIPKRNSKIKKRSMPMTAEQQKKFVSNLKNTSLDNFIYMSLATGGRLAEITALTWEDYTGHSIIINKQYRKSAEIKENGEKTWHREISVPKSDTSIREIPVTDTTIKMLNRQKEITLNLKRDSDHFIDRNLIFPDDKGNYIESKRPTRRVKTICESINLPTFTFHELRHSYATRLYEQGVPVRTIQLLLGHYDIRTTEIYVTVLDDSKKSAVDLLDGII